MRDAWSAEPHAQRAIEKVSSQRRQAATPLNLDEEVDNGGFDQFFFNSSGSYALDTDTALRDAGLNASADVFDEALKAFPGVPERDTAKRRLK